MLENLNSKLDYLKPWKLIPSFMEAVSKAREAKDKSFFEKIKIFFTSFTESMKKVKDEEGKTTEEANKSVEQGVDETLKDFRESTKLNASVSKEDQEFYDEVGATAVKSFKSMDNQHQGHFHTAFEKINKTSGPLSFEEIGATAAVGLMTLTQLKKKYPNKNNFKKALDKINSISSNSKHPLKKLMSKKVLRLFKMENQTEGIKFLKAFGISVGISDVWGGGQASKAKELFAQIGKRNMNKKDELVDFMKKYIFKNTNKNNIGKAIEALNRMAIDSKVDSTILTKLAFSIDDKDYEHIVTALVGQNFLKAA